ncbi:hypothetical protein [Variovorax sp.]|uniref:hypothetical protein n=1 Tax=Variovorax sp. TaxID=1871043 RepID=UPI003BAC58C6
MARAFQRSRIGVAACRPRSPAMAIAAHAACTCDGIAGALQYRWRGNNGVDRAYIEASGRGVVQVFTDEGGR